jgi:hypothetical protein
MNQLTITFEAMALHSRQDRAVKEYLEKHGVIDRNFAEMVGLPECGKVRNLAARIMELRRKGMRIVTDTKTDPANCHYKLANE